jgi:MFS family permease
MLTYCLLSHYADDTTDFDNPQGSLKGIIAAAYSLGAILSLPFIPIVNDKFGRRWSIVGGSVIMIVGALIQGFSQHGQY